MFWIPTLVWLFVRFGANIISLVTAAVTFATGCVYFKLWKGYDVLIIGVHLVLCIIVPFFRHDSSLIATCMFFDRVCRRNMSCKNATVDIFKSELFSGSTDDKKRRRHIISALSLSFFILRIRVSVALIVGRFHHFVHADEVQDIGRILFIFYKLLYIDTALVFAQLGWAFFRQFQVCCQLGCVKYYLWAFLVFGLGFICMEVPMQYALVEMDRSWCCWDEKNHTLHSIIKCPRVQ